MNSGDHFWFTALQLSLLAAAHVINFPRNEKNARIKARQLNWESREVECQGGRGGVRTEFKPPNDILVSIHEFVNNNPDFLKKRRGKDNQTSDSYPISNKVTKLATGSGIHNDFKVSDHSDSTDTIFIEHYVDVRGAAGAGQIPPADQMIVSVAVNAVEWRSYVGLNPKHIKVINVYGDSMKPTLQHGDQVLVDTACNRFVDDSIYAIQQDDVLRIKRIKLKLDGSIEVKSDNSHGFETEIYNKNEAAMFIVFGRVLPFKFGKFDL